MRVFEMACADWLLWRILIMAVCSDSVVSRLLTIASISERRRYIQAHEGGGGGGGKEKETNVKEKISRNLLFFSIY
jgi:hypothetical protein